eukprot:scaffold23786_cov129-Isochrysis_galbana.AAC.10
MHRVSATGPKAEPWPWAGYAPVALRFASETRSRREMLGRRYLVMLGYLVMRWSHSAWIDADYEKPGLWARTWAFVHRLHICGRAGRRWRINLAHTPSHSASPQLLLRRSRSRSASAVSSEATLAHCAYVCQLSTGNTTPPARGSPEQIQVTTDGEYILHIDALPYKATQNTLEELTVGEALDEWDGRRGDGDVWMMRDQA